MAKCRTRRVVPLGALLDSSARTQKKRRAIGHFPQLHIDATRD